MKKYLSVILVLIMIFALCACNKEDSPTIDGDGKGTGTTTSAGVNMAQFKGKLLEPTIKLIASGNYMYEIKSPESESPVTYARYGSNYLITCTVNGTPTTYIVKDGKKFIAFSAEKIYAQLTESDLKQYNISQFEKQLSSADFSTFSSYTYKSSGETAIGDVNYKYEEYYSPLSQKTNRFCFDPNDGSLKYITAVNDDGTTGSALSISLYESNASVFDVLNTYTLVDLNSQTAMQPSTNSAQ